MSHAADNPVVGRNKALTGTDKLTCQYRDEYTNEPNPTTILALQNALKKALTWNQALMTGQVSNMARLAKQENVTQRYIAHLTKLAYLSPDIMETIIKGDLPPKLSLDRLKRGIPLDWEEQRQEFGFTR